MRHLATLIFFLTFNSKLLCQDVSFRPTYVLEGYIRAEKQVHITFNFLVLSDSTMVGSYFYKPKSGSLKLVGHLAKDNTFTMVERDSQNAITGFFEGKFKNNFTFAEGIWISPDRSRKHQFLLEHSQAESYWDYIKKFRSLKEHKNIKQALKEAEKVVSIDVANQNIGKLPAGCKDLKNVLSINLLGNDFESFPSVLSGLTQLEEISLSSNRLQSVGPEIGKLTSLRILIMNNNQLKSLPGELGQLENLLYLELGNNNLTSLPNEINKLSKLQELHLERNQFSEEEKNKIKSSLPNCVIHF
jgi:Leucine-rich repeat (LRR) protein